MRDAQLERVRRMCLALPSTSEKLSHGEPTFFLKKRVFAMFSGDHHHDNRIALIIPALPGMQNMLVTSEPRKFYVPPYVGVRGWIGIELDKMNDDEELAGYIQEAWRLISRKK